MPRRSHPVQVVNSYVEYLNSLINGVLSDSRLVSLKAGGGPQSRRNITSFQGGARLPIRLKPAGFLFFDQLVEVVEKVGGQALQVLTYTHIFGWSDSQKDKDAWVFRYEYDRHPNAQGKPHAHLHLNAHHSSGFSYEDYHFPTGRISVEQLIAILLHEWEIEPRMDKDAAFDTLRESYAGYVLRRTDLQEIPPPFP